jgi:hypothetical protein
MWKHLLPTIKYLFSKNSYVCLIRVFIFYTDEVQICSASPTSPPISSFVAVCSKDASLKAWPGSHLMVEYWTIIAIFLHWKYSLILFSVYLRMLLALYPHCAGNSKHIFPEMKLRGQFLHSCISEWFICFHDQSSVVRSCEYKSLTDTWMWKLGDRTL